MKPSETAQINFIADCLRKGEQRKVILSKFGKKWQGTSARTFDRRLRQAEIYVASEQATIKAKAEDMVSQEADALKSKIMSSFERKVLLSQIAKGEITVKRPVVISGQVKLVPHEPDHNERINAMKELSKMDGDYAATRIDAEVSATFPGIDKIEIVHTNKDGE